MKMTNKQLNKMNRREEDELDVNSSFLNLLLVSFFILVFAVGVYFGYQSINTSKNNMEKNLNGDQVEQIFRVIENE